MDNFLTWEVFFDYVAFVSIVFSIVACIKNWWIFKKIPTRLLSIIVAFLLLTVVNLQAGTFHYWDLVLYLVNAIVIAMTANGMSDANEKKEEVDV